MTRIEYIAWMVEEIQKCEKRCDEAMIEGNDFLETLYTEQLYYIRKSLNIFKGVL